MSGFKSRVRSQRYSEGCDCSCDGEERKSLLGRSKGIALRLLWLELQLEKEAMVSLWLSVVVWAGNLVLGE